MKHRSQYRAIAHFGAAIALLAVFGIGCADSVRLRQARSFTNSVGMEMIALSSGIYVSRYETTQKQYERVMGSNPMTPACPECPVANITGDEALLFCAKLTELERTCASLPARHVYRLPTYDEYLQYVADAPLRGSVTPRGGKGGAELRGPLPVGSGESNRLGVWDLRGNVSEYLCDRYNTGSLTIVGPFWNEHREDFLAVRNRGGFMRNDEKSPHVGFRCVLAPAQ